MRIFGRAGFLEKGRQMIAEWSKRLFPVFWWLCLRNFSVKTNTTTNIW